MNKAKAILKNTWTPKTFFIDTLYNIAGSILFSIALYTFAYNANFAPGGISGLSLIINRFTSWPIGITSLAINIPLAIICVRIIGIPFFLRSGWSILLSTFFIDVVFPSLPRYEGNQLLAALFTGASMGASLAIIYSRGSSTGGTDFIILSVKKLRPHFSVGQISLILDLFVIGIGGLAFGNIDAVLYGIVATFAATLTMDNFLSGTGGGKIAMVITTHGQEIADIIHEKLNRGSTLVKATGTYTQQERDILYCVCSNSEITKVRHAVEKADRNAMVIVTSANEVLGEGFAPSMVPGNETKLRTGPLEKPVKKVLRYKIKDEKLKTELANAEKATGDNDSKINFPKNAE